MDKSLISIVRKKKTIPLLLLFLPYTLGGRREICWHCLTRKDHSLAWPTRSLTSTDDDYGLPPPRRAQGTSCLTSSENNHSDKSARPVLPLSSCPLRPTISARLHAKSSTFFTRSPHSLCVVFSPGWYEERNKNANQNTSRIHTLIGQNCPFACLSSRTVSILKRWRWVPLFFLFYASHSPFRAGDADRGNTGCDQRPSKGGCSARSPGWTSYAWVNAVWRLSDWMSYGWFTALFCFIFGL